MPPPHPPMQRILLLCRSSHGKNIVGFSHAGIYHDMHLLEPVYGRPSPLRLCMISSILSTHKQLLDQAESFSVEHTNRFGGRRSNLSDFAKGALLADPRRMTSSKNSASATAVSGRIGGHGSNANRVEPREEFSR